VAGMLAEMKMSLLKKEYPELKDESMQIHVIDGAPALLFPMSKKTHRAAYKILHAMGINVKLNVQVTQFEKDQVHLSDGEVIDSKTLIWAAGVVANTFDGIDETSLGRGRRMMTDAFNQVKGYSNIYAIGDISIQSDDKLYPYGHPQLAQPAIQQGKRLAKNLRRLARGRAMKPFVYFDRGEMAIIGRKHAMVDLFGHKIHFGGLAGLLSWLFIHLISLVNYNNIVKTLYGWTIAYLTKDQALRMIFEARGRGTVASREVYDSSCLPKSSSVKNRKELESSLPIK
jgi:NADH dehydrogenase